MTEVEGHNGVDVLNRDLVIRTISQLQMNHVNGVAGDGVILNGVKPFFRNGLRTLRVQEIAQDLTLVCAVGCRLNRVGEEMKSP